MPRILHSISIVSTMLVAFPAMVAAQVAAGGGGSPGASQIFSTSPRFMLKLFTRPGVELTSTQRRTRDELWRQEIRNELFVPPKLPPLQTHLWSTFSPAPGVLADRVTYATADGMRVPAIIYRPDPLVYHWRGKLPGIVIVNGHGGDKFSWYAFYSGVLFARAGSVVVTYDPIGEGERNHDRLSMENPSTHDAVVDLPYWGQRLAGLMQADLMQGVSYLREQPQVDHTRIAIAGYSMGAFISGIAGAIDLRIHAVLLSGGGTFDGPGEYFDAGKLPCQAAPYRALGVLGDRSAILFALNADRGPMYIMNGDVDEVMRMSEHPPTWFAEVRARAAVLNGSNRNLFITKLYPGVGHRPSWVELAGVLWLNHQLHFALWSDQDILAAGTTHISEWVNANHVAISKNYIVEAREGGLRAVGAGFPGIQRSNLMVLPEAEWQREKPILTYESWAEREKVFEEGGSTP